MLSAIEMQVRDLLLEFPESDSVINELVRRWEQNLFSPAEQDAVALFLLESGHGDRLCAQLTRLLKNKHHLPWAAFAEAIGRSGVRLASSEKTAFVDGLQEQKGFEEVLASNALDEWHPVFKEKRAGLAQKTENERMQRRDFLKDKIEFFRVQRMFDDEAKALAELKALSRPGEDEDNNNIQKAEQSLEERWAREIIASGPAPRDLADLLAQKSAELPSDQIEAKKEIVQLAMREATQFPGSSYDLALHLHFMDFAGEALEVLQVGPRTRAGDWLRLELLLKARYFVEALDESHRLEDAYADDPESTFSSTYTRAIALWELGQHSLAIEILRNIVNVRPDYKSAHSLLMLWTGGES